MRRDACLRRPHRGEIGQRCCAFSVAVHALRARLLSEEPAIAMNAPSQPRVLIDSGLTRPGATRAVSITQATVSSGVSAKTALTREASQCTSASAKAPYAPSVLSAQ